LLYIDDKYIKNITPQHYPPGTQEDYNSFSSRNLVMGKGTELEFPEGRGGGKGAASSPGVPPITPGSKTRVDIHV
jgi:hypothetical protein